MLHVLPLASPNARGLRDELRLMALLAVGVMATACSTLPKEPAVATVVSAPTPEDPPIVDRPRLVLPERPDRAEGGKAFLKRIMRLPILAREVAIREEILSGNVPDSFRRLVPVPLVDRDGRGRVRRAVVWVTPDYLAVGSDGDFVRVPMSLDLAARIAVELGMSLPTPRIVDAIYRAAHVRLAPKSLPVNPTMTSLAYAQRHNELIEGQLRAKLVAPGREGILVAGHKKDVVIAKDLQRRQGRVAIFGWHRADGKPIQALSTVHARWYSDYSHGIRLVGNVMQVDGRDWDLGDAIADTTVAPLLSHEGAFAGYTNLQTAIASGPVSAPPYRRGRERDSGRPGSSHWASED